jgi:hypothetical protein
MIRRLHDGLGIPAEVLIREDGLRPAGRTADHWQFFRSL